MSAREVIVVVQKGDHSLGYYDFETGAELDRVLIDPFPHEFAISPDGRLAYMAHFGVPLAEDEGPGGNTVSVVDIQARRRVGTERVSSDQVTDFDRSRPTGRNAAVCAGRAGHEQHLVDAE